MKKKIELTEDHIALIRNFQWKPTSDSMIILDSYDLFGSDFIFTAIARILDVADKALPETIGHYLGERYEPDTQERIERLADDLAANYLDYEALLHQFADRGLQPGFYTCDARVGIWKKCD